MHRSIGVWAVLALCACGQREVRQSPSAEAPTPGIVASVTPAPSASTVSAAEIATPGGPVLPARFTAVGTEPFWAAKVDGERLVYSTPEDQAGKTIQVSRSSHGAFVELRGILEGRQLALTISAGPCSDGMSDTVYPFAVRRRLGEDEQRGCAKPG